MYAPQQTLLGIVLSLLAISASADITVTTPDPTVFFNKDPLVKPDILLNQSEIATPAVAPVATDNTLEARINAAIMGKDCDPMYGAPTILVVLADANARCGVQDGSLVMGNLMNAAAAIGLGSCWINRAKEEFETEEGKALLRQWGIEGDWVGVGHCILGYPAEEPRPAAPRKPDYIVKV